MLYRLVLLCFAGALAACDAVPRANVGRDWTETIADLGFTAIYPVRQDANVGDLLVAAKYGDGHGSVPADESWIRVDGLNSIAATIDDMLRRETDPSYQPVSKKYVLGLVRLPNGVWAYRLPRRERESVGYGY